jgi:hypothetical protein
MTQQSVLALLDGRLPEYTVNRDVQWRALRPDWLAALPI